MRSRRNFKPSAFLAVFILFLINLDSHCTSKDKVNYEFGIGQDFSEVFWLDTAGETKNVSSFSHMVCNKRTSEANYSTVGTADVLTVGDQQKTRYTYRKSKKTQNRCLYYPNSCASRQILLQGGDILINPGPPTQQQQQQSQRVKDKQRPVAPRCTQCEKPVAKNHKRCFCTVCFDLTHVKCTKVFNSKDVSSSVPKEWVCHNCTISVLPFHKHNFSSMEISAINLSDNRDLDSYIIDKHFEALQKRSNQLKLFHLNTRSMVSSFDELLITMNGYPFDIITMRETWLKDNPHLLQYVTVCIYYRYYSWLLW